MKSKIMPPTVFLIFLLAQIGVHFVVPVMKVVTAPYRYLGIVPIVFGIVLNIWADALFKKKATTVKPYEDPSKLEVLGPFRISRHPMYLGMAAILFGSAVALGSLTSFVFPIAYVIITELMFIRFEERNLERIFSKEYIEYKRKVRRWI
jgi:protein-S-isoprenylcysteine O-methyltransferase Ste14